MPRLQTLGDDHFRTDFQARTTEISGRTILADDGRPVREWFQDSGMEVTTKYDGTLESLDGRWVLLMEWVDHNGKGHRHVFPHEVVERMQDAINRIADQKLSARGRRAAETRRLNAQRALDESEGNVSDILATVNPE